MKKQDTGGQSEMTPEQKVWLGRLMRVLCPVLALFLLFTFRFEDLITGFWMVRLIAVVALFVAGSYGKRMTRKNLVTIKKAVAVTDVKALLKEEFEHVVYEKERFLPKEQLEPRMGFPFTYDRVTGRDYVSAQYHGCSLELSDICLQERNPEADDRLEAPAEQTRFQGVWLILHPGKTFPTEITVRSLEPSGEDGEKPDFDRVFEVTADDPSAIDAVLTPQLREYLLYLHGIEQKKMYLHFCRDGMVHVAVDLRRKFFGSGSFDVNPEHLRVQFVRQLRAIEGLIDACPRN